MPTCPNCGHSFKAKPRLSKDDIELSIKVLQKQLGSRSISLKREIAKRFGVRKFADVPKEKHAETLEYAAARVEELTACWGANKVLKEAIPKFLKDISGASSDLGYKLEIRLREQFSDRYWADMDIDQAVEAIREAIGNRNIWEYAYKPTG